MLVVGRHHPPPSGDHAVKRLPVQGVVGTGGLGRTVVDVPRIRTRWLSAPDRDSVEEARPGRIHECP
jgi:hypothetical protein